MAALRPAPEDDDDLPEPPRVRALRRLVTVLTATLIVGVVAIAGALVIRIARPPAPPAIPASAAFDVGALTAETVALPEGEAITALGAAGSGLMIATRDATGAERLRLYGPDGALLRVVGVRRVAAE
jgi:hypothetical protein